MKKYKILKDLIKFNTIKDKENKEIINYIEEYLKRLNFKTEYKSKNLIMSIGREQKIGFLGHTDTVEYIKGWNSDPFELTEINNKLYGLGTCDMKGGIAAMLDAISQIDFSKLKYGMKLYFTYDEEVDFGGINELVNMNCKFSELMIFGEPTNNEILVGSKGLLAYELEFVGKKAHSSNPEKGISANINAINFLSELMQFYEENIKPFKVKEYEIPYTTMNVGLINGGSAINSIPASCKASLDFRIADNKHIELIKNKINELSEKYMCKPNVLQCIESFVNKTDLEDTIKTANFITEASFINNSTKVILGTGPVTAHEVNEYVTKESYDMLVKQYKEIIQKVCKKLDTEEKKW